MSTLNEHSANLAGVQRRLQLQWEATCAVWDDSVRREYEAQHWEPLARETAEMIRAMEQLAQVVAQARQRVN